MLDVLVVGGGISGLYAAYLLKKSGATVEVLEAQERLGGRLYTIFSPEGHPIDLGGQWIGPQHHRLLKWIAQHQIPLHKTHTEGYNLLITPSRRRKYKGTIPRLPWGALIDLGIGLEKLKRMAQQVSPTHPWEITRPAWDEITLAAWIRKTFYTQTAKETFRVGLATVLGCEPEEVSLWHTLFYIRSAGSLEALIETENGAQELKFSKGASSLIETFADKVPHTLGDPVVAVERLPNKVQVRTQNGRLLSARAVIVAVPPAVQSRIHWEPPLPPLYAQLSQHMPMGSITKVVAIYRRPFWREEGLSGHILRLQGGIRITFDTSPPDGAYGQITAFAVGPLARSLLRLSPTERERYYGQEMEALFGQKPQYLYQKTWADEPWTGGCYVGYFGPGGWRYFGPALRDPLPPLYWAGTERAHEWMGYMEGGMAAAETTVQTLLTSA